MVRVRVHLVNTCREALCANNPKKPAPTAAKPQKKAAKPVADELEDSFSDLDASDSSLEPGKSDSGLEDLKDL